jgi:murein DD-endopeptidase MepM/ murein hydrolase activator NlpD/Tol biopolymer transport system component
MEKTMKILSYITVAITLSWTALLAGSAQFLAVTPAAAQEGTAAADGSLAPTGRPFQLPFAQPPGLNTWLMAQPYGNTTGAYRQRFTTYGASGGIHFGVDLSAPCGTEVVAMADGIVFAVDGPFGSPPHNLMIDHPQLGYASMYGHLLEAPNLRPGDVVKQGQVIAYTGDAGETCYSRPHLHLEIRDLAHVRKYNPALLIDANWNNLALIGNAGRDFARNLEQPRQWQTIYDQPEVQTGGPIVNDFAFPWPFDWSEESNRPLTPASLISPASSGWPPSNPMPLATRPFGRQLTTGTCCTQPYWTKDSTQVRFIDQPGSDAPLGIWGVNLAQPENGPQFVSPRLGIFSPDGRLVAYPNRQTGGTVIERLADGQTWEIDTQGQSPNFTPDSRHIIWAVFDEDAPSDNREETLWQANVDGSNPQILLKEQRIGLAAWLADNKLLLSQRIPGGSDVQLLTVSLINGQKTKLLELPRMRGQALSLDRRYLVYYVSFEPEAEKNGLWLLDLQDSKPIPQKLPFFGSYRWRDAERLIYVPFEPEAAGHNFFEYNTRTGQTRPLFLTNPGLTIANSDWRVSPDGRKIALVAANDTTLDGIWVLELD